MQLFQLLRRIISLMNSSNKCLTFTLLLFLFQISFAGAAVTSLDSSNINTILSSTQFVFVNFYADWCRFSQILKPIFEEASDKFKDSVPSKIIWASVDSDRNADIAQKYSVNKYPTMKLFINGEIAKKEYRGQRSVEALSEFVKNQMNPGINKFNSPDELEAKIKTGKRNIIAYFGDINGNDYKNFEKVACSLKEDCVFWLGSGDVFKQQTIGGNNVASREPGSREDQLFSGSMDDYEYMRQWLTDKCIPLVREITFENAEELTEEGLPFLILFRHPTKNTQETDKLFTELVVRELHDHKSRLTMASQKIASVTSDKVNCLVADGQKFAHPLHHLGKTESDLPLLAIDSFRHIEPGRLRQFVLDLHSGKLHREFHNGSDTITTVAPGNISASSHSQHIEPPTAPPESVFNKLKPSHNRYTLLDKEEL